MVYRFFRLYASIVMLSLATACAAPSSSTAPPATGGPTVPPPPPPPPAAVCADTLDNDADGKTDFPADPGCFSLADTDEKNPAVGPGNAHRAILWTRYDDLIVLSDAQLDLWKSRGVDGFVVQTKYLDEIGGVEMWTGDPAAPLSGVFIEGSDVHEKQRALRDTQFVQRCHARGMAVYLGFYLSNYHNLKTPLKVWNDDQGWKEILPIVRGAAGAAKLLGMDGVATDSEMYRDDSQQTWNWNYPGVTEDEGTVRALARQRGREFMTAVLEGFPNVAIVNYRIEIPGDWEERVQLQVNKVAGVWDKSVFPDFWGGVTDEGGFSEIYFLDPIFYKSWHIRSGWDEALDYNRKGVRETLSRRWANWEYAAPRFFITPFAWIDPGPSASEFDDARPPDHVARQLDAFHRWGEGNTFGIYAQHLLDFDYTPYVAAMQAASTPDAGTVTAGQALQSQIAPDAAATPGPVAAEPLVKRASLRFERVAGGLREPTDAAFSPDGRLFIAERSGTIRILRDGKIDPVPALALDDVSTVGGNGLLALTLDPEFQRSGLVYVVYTALSRSGATSFRLARFREVQHKLGERAILLDGVPAARVGASAALRFGPDGKLYVAFDAAGDPRRIADGASYNGKILRLNADGRTPSDQPVPTPVFASGVFRPAALAGRPDSPELWVAGRDFDDRGRLRRIVRETAQPGEIVNASSMTFYRGALIPSLAGSLLVARGDEPTITRIGFAPADPGRVNVMETLLDNAGGLIRALTVSPGGAIYFCVNDAVARLVPHRPD